MNLNNFGRFNELQHQPLSKKIDLSKINMKMLANSTDSQLNEEEDFAPSSDLIDLTDILLEKNSYARQLHGNIQDIVMRPEIQQSIK